MTKLLFASHNLNKVKEIKAYFSDTCFEIISLTDLNDQTKIEEYGKTFQENALIKARYFFNKYHLPTIADDSGLEIKALKGYPGVETKRKEAEIFQDQGKKLFEKLTGLSKKAAFKVVLCLYFNGYAKYFTGEVKGEVKPCSEFMKNTFLYDNIFWPRGAKRAFCEFSVSEKNKISHRGQAISKLIADIKGEFFLFDPKKTACAFIKDTFGLEPECIDRLEKGRQNFVFKFQVFGKLYTIRIPGFPTYPFISYLDEEKILEIAEKNAICPKTIYHNPDIGIKISRYVENALHTKTDLKEVVLRLKTLHQMKKAEPFDYITRLDEAIKMSNCVTDNLVFKKGYQLFKAEHKDLFNEFPPCQIHGDFQTNNILVDKYLAKPLISDFEFTRTGYAIEDIASFAGLNLEKIKEVFLLYFGKEASKTEIKAVLFARLFQMLFWNAVANFKKDSENANLFNLNWLEIEAYLNNEVKNAIKAIEDLKWI